VIVNVTAKLEISYRHSAQLCWTIHVSIQMSSPLLHHAYYRKQTGHAESRRWEVSSQLQLQRAAGSCSVLCACYWLQAKTLSFLLHMGLQILAGRQCEEPVDASERCVHSLKQIKAEPAPPPTGRSTNSDSPSILVLHCPHSCLLRQLGLLFYTRWHRDRDQLLMTSRSPITLLSDRGKS